MIRVTRTHTCVHKDPPPKQPIIEVTMGYSYPLVNRMCVCTGKPEAMELKVTWEDPDTLTR